MRPRSNPARALFNTGAAGLLLVLSLPPIQAFATQRPAPSQASTPAALAAPSQATGLHPQRPPSSTPDPKPKRKPRFNTVAPPRSLERAFLRNLLDDQKTVWTSPFRLRPADASWALPVAGIAAGLIATDDDTTRHVFDHPSQLSMSKHIGDAGLAFAAGGSLGVYLLGRATHNDHQRETGMLAGEALATSLIVDQSIGLITQRSRPDELDGRGRFWTRGSSFPSTHAVAAWSVASVLAEEYPGILTRIGVYGLASAVSLSRLSERKHFPADVFVGSAIGWAIGRNIYRKRHNGELDGAQYGTFSRDNPDSTHLNSIGSPYVPLDSWIYPGIDRLAAMGYIDSGFAGLRPWTRWECARLLQEGEERLAAPDAPPIAQQALESLQAEFTFETSIMQGGSARSAHIESAYLRMRGIGGQPLTDGYHFGQTITNDFGRPYSRGLNAIAGVTGSATAGPLALFVTAEYQHAPAIAAPSAAAAAAMAAADIEPLGAPLGASPTDRVRLLDTYVALNLHDNQLSFGKQSLWWGPSRGGPFLMSDNAEPIYMFRVSRVTPFKLPALFSRLGPIRTEFFVGALSGHTHPHRAFLHGQKMSFKPTPNLEFGFSRTTVFGGTGHPITPHNFVRSLFSVGDNPLSDVPGNDPGDRRGGFDFNYRLPFLRKWVTLYNDSFVDDDPSPLAAPRRAAMNPGIYISHLPFAPRLDLRVESVYTALPNGRADTGQFFYFNTIYHQGYTNKGALLGNWVGRAGRGYQAWTTWWFSPKSTLQFGYRGQTVEKGFIPNGGHLNDFSARSEVQLKEHLHLSAQFQYEHWGFPVLSSLPRNNVTSTVQLTYTRRP